MVKQEFSKYEKARILGARALQISMDAPVLIKLSEEELEELNYNPLRIAEKELEEDVLPITVNRPLPGRREKSIEKVKIEEKKEEKEGETEEEEIKKIAEEAEIMELANPEDESDLDSDGGSSEE